MVLLRPAIQKECDTGLPQRRKYRAMEGTFKLSRDWCQAQWYTPVTSVPRKQRQEDSRLQLFGPTGQGKTLVGLS